MDHRFCIVQQLIQHRFGSQITSILGTQREKDSVVAHRLRPLYFNPSSPCDCGGDCGRGGGGGEDGVAVAAAVEVTAAGEEVTAAARVWVRGMRGSDGA
jgi:hypothetical protein